MAENILTLLLSAQRYTGYGRGYDWGGRYSSSSLDYLFPLMIIIVIIIVGIVAVTYKIKSIITKLNDSGLFNTSLTSLTKFIQKHGNMEVQTYIDEQTGEYIDLCVCTNYRGKKTFIGFSAYFGKPTIDEINKRKDKLFINHEEEGCYFLCSIESEKERLNSDNNDWRCYEDDDYMKHHLRELNIKHNLLGYTKHTIKGRI